MNEKPSPDRQPSEPKDPRKEHGVGSEIKLLSRHTSVYGLSNILNRIVSFILLPLYTRYLSPADYGVMDLLYFTTAFIGILLEVGINTALSRFYFDSDDPKERNKVVTTAYYGFGVGSTVIILILIAFAGPITSLIFKGTDYKDLMILALVGLGLDMYIKVSFTYLRVRMRSFTLMMVSVSRLIMQLSMNIIFIVYLDMGVKGILLSTVISNIVLVLFLLPYVLRETGLRFSKEKFKEMFFFGLPLIPSNFMAYMVNVSDRYFVNAFSGLTLTGLYTLGYRFGVLVNEFFASPFAQVWIPRRYEMYKRGDSVRVFGKIFTYFSTLLFFGGLAISILSKDVIKIMADESFWGAHFVVPIITLSYVISSFQMHFNIGIMIEKKTKYILYINIVTAVLNLTLNYFLIKNYDMFGAAYATLISFTAKVILVYIVSNRLVPIRVEWARFTKAGILALAMFFPINMIDTGTPMVNLVVKGVAILGYPLILYLIRFFDPGELQKGWDLARPIISRFIPMFRD